MSNNEQNEILEELRKINKRISQNEGYLKELEHELSLSPAWRKRFRKETALRIFFLSLFPFAVGIFLLSEVANPKVNPNAAFIIGTGLIIFSIAANFFVHLGIKRLERREKALKESQLEDGLE